MVGLYMKRWAGSTSLGLDALLNATAWCWSESLGWFWTSQPYFHYIFVNEFSKWMLWQGGVNELDGWSLMTDYATKEVVLLKFSKYKGRLYTILSIFQFYRSD